MNSSRFHIYTVDGYLVTTFSCGELDTSTMKSVKMYFSSRMFVLLVKRTPSYMHELIQCNEYTFIRYSIINHQRTICFNCDQDYIYVSRTHAHKNYIDLYSHDVQIFRTIDSIPGSYIVMQVRNIFVFVLNKAASNHIPNSPFVTNIVQLSLTSGEIIGSFDIPCSSFPYPTFISFHPLGYVIIGYTSTERLDVLYLDKIVRYNNLTSFKTSFAISSMATTVKGDLIYASYLGKCIRVYPAV